MPQTTLFGYFRACKWTESIYLGYFLALPAPNVMNYTAAGSCLIEYNKLGAGVAKAVSVQSTTQARIG